MIKQIHILGKIRTIIKFDLFISFISSAPCTQTDNDVLPPPVIVTPRINTPTNQRRLHRFFSRFSRSNRQSIRQKQKKLAEIHESYRSHRPYFTYWVTFVQILVCIVSLIVYGYAPLSSTQSVII
jgi:hypothetical protein